MPPLVKITSSGRAPTSAATFARAASIGCARRPSLGMDRRRIAVKRERRDNSLADFVAKRRGGVIVEIGTLVHALTKLAANRRRLTLARAPVARAMKRGPKFAPLQVPSCSGSGLVWNNSNLKLYRFPERQSQVLRRRFRASHLPCANALQRSDLL